MTIFRLAISCLLVTSANHTIQSCSYAETEVIKKFQSTPVQIEDRFQKDTRENYKIIGDVSWEQLEMSLKPGSTLARVEILEAKFRYEVDLWAGKLGPSERSRSRINLILTNNWELEVVIDRGIHKGRLFRQVVITEVDRRDQSAEKPTVTELRRYPPFTLPGELERWSLRYNFGILELHCNDKKLGTTFSSAFSSWLLGIAITQDNQEVIASRLLLSGKSIGYSRQQRELYNRSNRLSQQAAKAAFDGNLQQAIELEKSTIPILKQAFGENDFAIGLLHQRIAGQQVFLKQHAEARLSHENASSIFKESLGASHPATLLSDMYVAEQLVHEGRLDDAVVAMKTAIKAYLRIVGEKSLNSQAMLTRLVRMLSLQINVHFQNGEYQAAHKGLQEIVAIYTRIHGADHWATKDAQLELDFTSRILNSKVQELAKYDQYFHRVREQEFLTQQGKNSQALAIRKELLPVVRNLFGNLHPKTAEILIALSIDAFNSGEVDQSITMLREGIEIHRKISGEDNPKSIYAMGLLGSQLSMLRRFSEATPLLKRACDLLAERGLDRTTGYANMRLELGRHLIRIGQRNEAAKHLTASLQLYRALGEHASQDALKASERLGDISRAAGRMDEAERHLDYQRKIVLESHGINSAPYLDILLVEAKHLYLRKKYQEAVKKYDEATMLADRFYGKRGRTSKVINEGLIEVYLALGDMPTVVKYFEERLEYELFLRESLFNVYSEREQLDRSVQDLNYLDALLILALEGHLEPERAYNHAIAFKGAVTAKQRSAHIAAHSPILNQLLEELKNIELQIVGLAGPDFAEQGKEEYNALTLQRDQIKEQLKKKSPGFRVALKRTNISDLQEILPANTVLIDYFEYIRPKNFLDSLLGQPAKIGMVAFVLAGDREVQLVDLGSVAPINNAWNAWREAMDAEPYYELKAPEMTSAKLTDQRGDALRKLIWDPIFPYLKNADTVVVSPSLHLVACPFAALPAESGESFLIEQFAFVTMSTPRLLPELLVDREQDMSAKLLLIGNIDYGTPDVAAVNAHHFFTKLPNANSELRSIRKAFVDRYQTQGLNQLLEKQASEANIRGQIVGSHFIHIVTHGFCLQTDKLKQIQGEVASPEVDTWVSGVALANGNRGILATDSTHEDGILWADEIAELDLSAVKLITLSACQTALGELIPGEGMQGAQRAIHVAGARSSLTTLWSVEDKSTKFLMSKFYEQLWGQQATKAKALQQAMIYMLREYGGKGIAVDKIQSRHRTPPALWAGFVLHGDWR